MTVLSVQAQTVDTTLKVAPVSGFAVDTVIGSMRHIVKPADTGSLVVEFTHYIVVDGQVLRQDPYHVLIENPQVQKEILELMRCYDVIIKKEIRNIVIQKIITPPKTN